MVSCIRSVNIWRRKIIYFIHQKNNMNNQNPSHAHIEIAEKADCGEAGVFLQDKKIGMIHTQADPKAEFDLVVEDNAGNEQLRKKVSNPTGRWGERIDLEVTDNQFKVRVENVKNAKVVDVFIE